MDLMGKNSMLIPMIGKEFYTEPPTLARNLEGTADSYRIYSGMLLDKGSKIPGNKEKSESHVRLPNSANNILAVELATRDQVYPNLGSIYGLAYPDGFATMKMKASDSWYEKFVISDIPVKKMILKRSNVKFWVTEEYDQLPSKKNPRGVKRVEVFNDALPRAFLVGSSVAMPEEQVLKFYYDSRFNPLKQVLLTESVSVKKTQNFSGKVEELRYSPNKVNLKTYQNGEGFLVLLDTFFPGWEVRVDGNLKPIYRANYFYRAVKLGPGTHKIEFSYVPVGLKMGIYISACTLVFMLFMFFKSTRKRF